MPDRNFSITETDRGYHDPVMFLSVCLLGFVKLILVSSKK
jgi:hypothetical protein